MLREETVRNAVSALHLFVRHRDYLVRDGTVQIIDEYTGRLMADRSWTGGLHQLIEAKEGCAITPRKVTLGQMTYQRSFRRYRRLAGMTGTAREVAAELWTVYRLPVTVVPTNRPIRRRWVQQRVVPTASEKWDLIIRRITELRESGRPVLIGTRTVAASEQARRRLSEAGIAHQLLNAAQDSAEASIIAAAGEPGKVTIATNMAGRGTDIRLAHGVAAAGGLHVIISERHDAGRIDRQLAGRCGRQGDPGTVEAIVSLEDSLLELIQDELKGRLAVFAAGRAIGLFGSRVMIMAQRKAERTHSRTRRDLLRMDAKLGNMLAFTGRVE